MSEQPQCTSTMCFGHQAYVVCEGQKKMYRMFDTRERPWQDCFKELDSRLSQLEQHAVKVNQATQTDVEMGEKYGESSTNIAYPNKRVHSE